MLKKFDLWLLSTSVMWILLLIKTWNVPICPFWKDYEVAALGDIFSPSNIVAYTSIVCIIGACVSLLKLKYRLQGSPNSNPIKIKKVTNKSQDYVDVCATLVTFFPLLTVSQEIEWRDFLIFIVVLFSLYKSYTLTNFYYANIIMALMGYKITEVETDAKCKELPSGSIVLNKRIIKDNDYVNLPYHVADNVYIAI